MSFASLFQAIVRRWYMVILGLLLTAGLGFLAAAVTPPQYAARGLIMVMPPTSEDKGVNPFLNLGGLDIPAGVVATYFTGDPAQREIQDKYPGSTVTVSIDDSTRGPVIAIDVLDQTPESSIGVLHYVAGQIPVVLASLQTQVGVGGNKALVSIPLTIDNQARADYHNFTRVVIAAAVVGLAGTAAITFGLDSLLLRRRSVRAPKPGTQERDRGPEQEAPASDEVPAGESVPRSEIGPELPAQQASEVVRELNTYQGQRRDRLIPPRRRA